MSVVLPAPRAIMMRLSLCFINPSSARTRIVGNAVHTFQAGDDAVFINPAQLGRVNKNSLSLSLSPYLTGIENGNIYHFLFDGSFSTKDNASYIAVNELLNTGEVVYKNKEQYFVRHSDKLNNST